MQLVSSVRSTTARAASAVLARVAPLTPLARIRWLFLAFSLVVNASIAMIVMFGAAVDGRMAVTAAAAVTWLGWRRIYEYRHDRPLSLPWDLVEGASLALIGATIGLPNTLGAFYLGIYCRSLYGTRRRALGGAAMYALSLIAAGLLSRDMTSISLEQLMMQVPSLMLSALVMHITGSTLRSHERALAREKILTGTAAVFAAAGDSQTIHGVVVEAARTLIARDNPDVQVLLWAGSADRMVAVAVAGQDARGIEGASFRPRDLPAPFATPYSSNEGVAYSGVVGPREALSAALGFEPMRDALIMPLRIQGELRGSLVVRSNAQMPADCRDALETLSRQASVALERMSLVEDLHRRRGEARFRALIQHGSDLVTIIDPSAKITYQSPSVSRVLGYESNGLLDTPLRDLLHPDDRAEAEALLAGIGEQLGASATGEWRLRRRDGSWCDVEVTSTNLFEEPTVGGYVLNMRDSTERKRVEQQSKALAQSEKLRALGQMASGIAHDLNQTLMLVVSYSDLASQAVVQDPPNLAEIQDLLTTTTQAALDGGETVKRLLLFTRAAPEHDSQTVDLGDLVRDAAQLTAPRWRDAARAEGRPISLHIEVEGHPTIQGSPAQLRELMTNLIFNAIDALPTGGMIRLRVVAADKQGIVEVADSGVGMSAEVQARVFEPFFTTKGESGTGLGLAMVFGIVEQHRGHIQVRSAPGDGTTFRITLPLMEASAEAAPSIAPAQLERSRPLRVLSVDDEPMMTKAVVRMLKPSGHVVIAAASGEEAMEKLKEQTFDVVVSDMGMGAGMNGLELADAVKHRWPGVRFLLATGWGATIDPGEAQARGVETVLSKPYHPVDLLRALARPEAAA